MSTTVDAIERLEHPAGVPSSARASGPWLPFAAPAFVIGVASAGAAVVSLPDVADPSGVRWAATTVAVVWGIAGVLIGLRRRREPLGLLVAAVAAFLAAVLAGFAANDTTSVRVRDVAAALLAAVLFHLAVGLPEGRLVVRWRRVLVAMGYGAAIVVGVTASDTDRSIGGATVGLGVVLTVVALGAYANRCRHAGAVERARLQWAGWGVVVAALVVLVSEILHLLLDWPPSPGAVAIAATGLIPVSLTLSSWDGMAVRIDRLLVHTIVVAGLVTIVAVVYLLVVLGLGDAPDEAARDLLGLSMVAAVLAAVVALPARRSLDEFARRRVYGDRRSPDEAIQTFGSRMSRAVPMDELLLQLAESLKLSMQLVSAEVWTGSDGVLERVVSVPDRGPGRLVLSEEELPVVARARVSGNAWLQVWLPSLVEGRGDCVVRVAPVVHSGILLGLIVAEREPDAVPFTDESERVLTELGAPGRARAAQRPARLRAAGEPRDAPGAQRGAPGLAAAHRDRIRRVPSPHRAQPPRRRPAAPRRARGQGRAGPPARGRRTPRRSRRCSRSCAATCRPRWASCASSRTASTRRCCATAGSPRPCAPRRTERCCPPR